MAFPTKETNIAILMALEPIANVRAIMYLPSWTIVDLIYGDGHIYEPFSLPGTVAGRTTLYHHEEEPFYKLMRNQTRARLLDPVQYMIAPRAPPQDHSNYLQHAFLTPGCRLESGLGPPGSRNESANCATSSGVKIRNARGEEALTVVTHGFLLSNEVYHPGANADKIGEVFDTRPELDVALVRLTPGASGNFTSKCYFQAEAPTKFLEGHQINQGSWSEVDGMSSGLVSLMALGRMFMRPARPSGFSEDEYRCWTSYSVNAVFGVVNKTITDGNRGAPIVDVNTGGVAGFFHLFDGSNCLSAHLDDLIADGWDVV